MASRIIDVTMQLIDKVTSPLSGINANLKDSSRQWQNAGKDIMKTGQAISKVGQTMTTAVTLPIVGAGVEAVKTAANFEAGMSKVQAISGATADEMSALNDKAMEMGAKTKFSATEAADAFSYMAMAGWKNEQMLSGIEGIMYLAGATGEELATTSDIVTDAMTAFGMAADGTSTVLKDGMEVEVSNVSRFVDVLAATANNANTNVSMLGESFKYVAPMAGAMGYSVEDVSVALGLMANSGIKASQGGTALRTLLSNMANPSDNMAQAMKTLGLSLDDGQGNMKSFMEIMQDLRTGFGNLKMDEEEYSAQFNELTEAYEAGTMSQKDYEAATSDLIDRLFDAEDAQKAQAASMLAGKTGLSGLLAIVNSSDEDFNKLTEAINGSNGACEKMYNITQDNLLGRLTILKSTLESIAIAFGKELIPYVEKATKFIQGLADKFNSLDSEQRQQIVKWAAIAAAVGPALLVFGKVVTTVGKVVSVVGKIGGAISKAGGVMAALSGPGAIVVAVLAAIGIAIALVVTHWDECKAAFQAGMDAIAPTLQFLKDQWTELTTAFKQSWTTHLKPVWDQFVQKVAEAWAYYQPIMQRIAEVVKDVFEIKFKFAIEVAVEVFKFLAEFIGTTIETVTGVFQGYNEFIAGVFTGDWERAWNGVKEIFSSVWDGIKSIASAAMEFISGIIGGVADAVSGLITLFGDAKTASQGINAPSTGSDGHFAVGTSYFRGGTATIHERGAEIVDLPRGTRIYPHDESLKMAYNEGRASGGGGKGNVSITVAKLADSIQVRSDSDIEAIAVAIANKLEQTAQNIGGGELGYIY